MKFWELKREYDTLASQELQVLSALNKLTGSNWTTLKDYDCYESVERAGFFASWDTRIITLLVTEYFQLKKDKADIDNCTVLDCAGIDLDTAFDKYRGLRALTDYLLFDIGITNTDDVSAVQDHIKSLSKYITKIKERK